MIDPISDVRRLEIMLSNICALIVNTNVEKKSDAVKAKEFLPDWSEILEKQRNKTPKSQEERREKEKRARENLERWVLAQGGEIRDKSEMENTDGDAGDTSD